MHQFGIVIAQQPPSSTASRSDYAPLLLLPIIAIPIFLVLVFVLRRRKRSTAAGDLATCGHCGYAVTGLTTFTCPECGRDLREVGIVRSRHAPVPLIDSQRPGRFALIFRIVGWKLLTFGVLFSIAAFFVADYFADMLRSTTWVESQVVEATPGSGSYAKVIVTLTEQFTARGRSPYRDPHVDQRKSTVDLKAGPDRFVLTRDVNEGTNTYLDSSGVQQQNTKPLSIELRAWMSGHGVNVAPVAVANEIDAIANAITQSRQQGAFWELMVNGSTQYFRRDSVSTSSHVLHSSNYDLAASSISVAIGVAGMLVIWLRNRTRLAAALAEIRLRPSNDLPFPATSGDDQPSAHPATTIRTLSVMFSDVKDYTARTAQESRIGVLDLVRRHRDLAQPIIKQRGGRIVKSLGDGLLITFESATDAVLAGLQIQAAAANHNQGTFADRDKIELRIAVSTGEVVTEGSDGDVLGEAVNLASRAQQQAAAGEVLFTEATCATINRREVPFEEAGTFELKGIAHSVHLYRALSPSSVSRRA
jgi:class 3 adenylate cyclase